MSSAGRAVMYGLPAVTIALTAAVMLGPGRARAAVGVRIWGLPVAGGEALALRLQGVRRLLGVEDAAALPDLAVRASAGGEPLGRWASAAPAEIAEALLEAPAGLRPPLRVAVLRGGEALLEAEIPLQPAPAWPAGPRPLPGVAEGALRVSVELARGALAAPFRGSLRVSVAAEGGPPAPGAQLEARAQGADLAGAVDGVALGATDASGALALGITPRAHLVELSLRAAREGASGRWEGTLPVVPGAIWVEPPAGGAGRARLVSPSPRAQAYVSLVGARGRVGGAIAPLQRDASGFHAGELDAGSPSSALPLWAVVAGDPAEQGPGTLAWPLHAAGPAVAAPRLVLLADGVPAAEAREQARAARARRAGLLVLGAAAAAEVLLAIALSRRARRRLADHLREASADDAAFGAPLPAADRARLLGAAGGADQALWALTLIALVALGFAAVAALATFR